MGEFSEKGPLRNMRATARPLLFKTGIVETPIATWGTCFLVARKGRIFAVTAAHLIRDVPSSQIVILPFDGSKKMLRLRNGIRWVADEAGEYDVIVYDVVLNGMQRRESEKTRCILLDSPDSYQWKPNAFTSQFFLVGHPQEVNHVDYDAGLVKSNQVLLAGRYLGPASVQQSIYQFEVENPLNLQHFRGMSGGPVMAIEMRLASSTMARFCGIAIWGTQESGNIFFLDSQIIIELLDEASAHWNGDGNGLELSPQKPIAGKQPANTH